ncbi:MAG: GNAT family N-acetyltransferase [Neorhizobium sp.]|nr:GNAT family N-acetyltransferase [Neorhizobium sp.]
MPTIRNAREDDAEIIAEIGFRAWEKAMVSIGEMAGMRESARNAFQSFAVNSWLTATVIEHFGAIAGWAAREKLDELISDFWIDPSCQGQGLGKALLAEVEAEIVRQGFDIARVETHAGNVEAIGFFEKQDYRIHWFTTAYAPKIDRDVQSVGMSKPLGSGGDGTYGPGI